MGAYKEALDRIMTEVQQELADDFAAFTRWCWDKHGAAESLAMCNDAEWAARVADEWEAHKAATADETSE